MEEDGFLLHFLAFPAGDEHSFSILLSSAVSDDRSFKSDE